MNMKHIKRNKKITDISNNNNKLTTSGATEAIKSRTKAIIIRPKQYRTKVW